MEKKVGIITGANSGIGNQSSELILLDLRQHSATKCFDEKNHMVTSNQYTQAVSNIKKVIMLTDRFIRKEERQHVE